eukprot:8025332-Pyramimonas_sp.AAC.1
MATKFEKLVNHEVLRDLRDAGALGTQTDEADKDGEGDSHETPPKRARATEKQPVVTSTQKHGMQA